MTGETSTLTISPHLMLMLSEEERNSVFETFYHSLKSKGDLIEVDYRFMCQDLGPTGQVFVRSSLVIQIGKRMGSIRLLMSPT
jgi:hypothetical protein